MPTCTAIIPRPADAPPIRVLECDGPFFRRHPVQRGEGCYYLATSNHPPCDEIGLKDWYRTPETNILKDFDQPCWELYQRLDGTVTIHACRPSAREVRAGDLHGRWDSDPTCPYPAGDGLAAETGSFVRADRPGPRKDHSTNRAGTQNQHRSEH